MNDVKWITKNGVHIPITNEYMNDKIRNIKIKETQDKDFKNYYTLKYLINNKEAGYLEYQKNNDNITINALQTKDEFKRKGVMTSLFKELKNKYGDKVYKVSAVLDDGEKFLKSKTNIIKKDGYDYYVKIK